MITRFNPLLFVALLVPAACFPDEGTVPRFTAGSYRASLVEQNFTGQVAVHPPLAAVDPDARRNSTIHYDIIGGNEEKLFLVESDSGTLSLVRPVDREKLASDSFNLQVQASFSGHPRNVSTASVRVEVVDINDNAPVFEVSYFNISIVENLPNGFSILKVTATDTDQGDNGLFKYRLNDTSHSFSIEENTGWIVVSNQTKLDRESLVFLRLSVTAEEKIASSAKPGQAVVDVYFIDSNDNNPSFVPANVYKFVVDEVAPSGTIIGQVEAVDPDAEENGLVTYSIQRQELSNHNVSEQSIPFSIHPQSGHIFVVDSPLKLDGYTLLIEASDQPQNPSERRSSLALAQVSVIPQVDQVPHFVNTPYEFWIGATAPVETSVGQIRAKGFLEHEIRYSLERQHNSSVPFEVNPRTGTVRIIGDLDDHDMSTYVLKVSAINGIHQVSTNVSIHVVDVVHNSARNVRDTAPQQFSVQENQANAFIGKILYPHDGRLLSRRGLEFVLLENDPLADSIQLQPNGSLFTLNPLDREITSNISLHVIVQERISRKPVDMIQVTIDIVDVNDNPPRFEHSLYVGHVMENSPSGTLVQLMAPIKTTDADLFPNNIAQYALLGSESAFFSIDSSTGIISTTVETLDREATSMYNFSIQATDSSNLTARADIVVFIDDANDNDPQLVDFIPESSVVVIERSERNGKESRPLLCSRESSCTWSTVTDDQFIAPTGRSLGPLSKIKNDLHRAFNQVLFSSGFAANSSETQDLLVEQIFSTVLRNSTILIQVPENQTGGNLLGRFLARDDDETDRSELRFSLMNESRSFRLEPEKGTLFTKESLEPETLHTLSVKVVDSGGRQTVKNVTIEVVDINDHIPVFQLQSYEFRLAEGVYDNFVIAEIVAEDVDKGENARISYRIAGNETGLPFGIREDTGTLYATGTVDREVRDSFQFHVEASDHGNPVLQSTVGVTIYVNDVNDNPPRFLGSGDRSSEEANLTATVRSSAATSFPLFSVTVEEQTESSVGVITVLAVDPDYDAPNKNVSYRLETHQNLFRIDPTNGTVLTNVPLEYEKGTEYNVIVVASDQGTPQLSSTAVIHVSVHKAPCKEVPVLFDQQVFNITVEENVSVPRVVLNFSRHLKDFRFKLETKFELPSAFQLDPSDPVVKMISAPDRESVSSYQLLLTVQPIAKKGTRFCSNVSEELVVDVEILDVNDNAPSFNITGDIVKLAVSSESALGKEVFQFRCADADAGLNSLLKYTIESFGPKKFDMDPGSGSLRVSQPLIFDGGSVFNYVVKATDRNGAADGKSASVHLIVHIVDRIHQVTLLFATDHRELSTASHNITRMISSVIGMEVFILDSFPHLHGHSFDALLSTMVIYAVNASGRNLVGSEFLSRALYARKDELLRRLSVFNLREIRGTPEKLAARMTMEPTELTLVAMGAFVLLGTVIAVVCIILAKRKRCYRKRASQRIPAVSDYQLEEMSRATPLYHRESLIRLHNPELTANRPYVDTVDRHRHQLQCSTIPAAQQQHCCPDFGNPHSRRQHQQCHCCGQLLDGKDETCGQPFEPAQPPDRVESNLRRSSLIALHHKDAEKQQPQPRALQRQTSFGQIRINYVKTRRPSDLDSICNSDEIYEDSLGCPSPPPPGLT